MGYVIRNIHPSVIHIPDADMRLDSGQTAIVEALSPQMEALLAQRALEAISDDPYPPVVPAHTDETPVTPDIPASPGKKGRKSSAPTEPESSDDAQ